MTICYLEDVTTIFAIEASVFTVTADISRPRLLPPISRHAYICSPPSKTCAGPRHIWLRVGGGAKYARLGEGGRGLSGDWHSYAVLSHAIGADGVLWTPLLYCMGRFVRVFLCSARKYHAVEIAAICGRLETQSECARCSTACTVCAPLFFWSPSVRPAAFSFCVAFPGYILWLI